MKNAAFTLWLLLYFPMESLSEYLDHLNGRPVPEITGFTAITFVALWIFVAYKLYER